MKKTPVFLLVSLLCALALLACRREQPVQAGREESPSSQTETYRLPGGPGSTETGAQQVRGDLRRVDLSNKTIVVRTENGMEQTFRFNDATTVTGLTPPVSGKEKPGAPAGREQTGATQSIHALTSKVGSEVNVHWSMQGNDKVATSINVMEQPGPKKPGAKY